MKKRGCKTTPPFSLDLTYLLFYLGSLTNAITQIIKLRSADTTVSNKLNLGNVGRMYREYTLYAYAVSNTTYGKGFGDAAVILSDNSTLKYLNSLALAFTNLYVNTNSRTDVYNRSILAKLTGGKILDCVH